MTAAVTERGGMVVKRRKLLGGLFALGSTAMGVVLLFPLRSLGPKPAKSEAHGRDSDSLFDDQLEAGIAAGHHRRPGRSRRRPRGRRRAHRVPQGLHRFSPDQVILIRLAESLQPLSRRGAPTGASTGYVAYSKMCTHLGCPVGLYQEQTQQLVCPCHQSIFNVQAGAVPEFGPAPRPLPQLPITVDAAGYLVAKGGFDQPVGPGFWERP